MRRYELSDGQWDLIADLMPGTSARGGGRWRDHRQVVNGLLWRLNTGAQWRDLPERYGPWQTVYERLVRWRRDGTFDRVLDRLRLRLDEAGLIDPTTWCVDGTSIRAGRPAAGGGKRGRRTSPGTTRWAARAAGSPPSSIS
jgi:transposase